MYFLSLGLKGLRNEEENRNPAGSTRRTAYVRVYIMMRTDRNISNKMVTAKSSLSGLKGSIAVWRCIYQALVWPESGRDPAGITSRSC